ncbi:MAG: hypothetical protein HQL15_01415 [Candidatus Omnitrophica bacterium]|nr:hypothetical protein [Candidatus Omnitrophota bacterium]
MMTVIKGKPPLRRRGRKLWNHKKLTITLEKYYRRKKALEQEEFLDFHDLQLKKIFKSLASEEWLAFNKERRKNKNLLTAETLIRKYSKNLLNTVDRCTGERKYMINDLLKNISLRAKQLNMIVTGDPANSVLQLSVYVTSLVMNYVHTGLYRGKGKHL